MDLKVFITMDVVGASSNKNTHKMFSIMYISHDLPIPFTYLYKQCCIIMQGVSYVMGHMFKVNCIC